MQIICACGSRPCMAHGACAQARRQLVDSYGQCVSANHAVNHACLQCVSVAMRTGPTCCASSSPQTTIWCAVTQSCQKRCMPSAARQQVQSACRNIKGAKASVLACANMWHRLCRQGVWEKDEVRKDDSFNSFEVSRAAALGQWCFRVRAYLTSCGCATRRPGLPTNLFGGWQADRLLPPRALHEPSR